MLLVETRGRPRPDVQNWEDYLTSTVFGHLRYLPPALFWNDLLHHARNFPMFTATLSESLQSCGLHIPDYEMVKIHFWPRHHVGGGQSGSRIIPDMVVYFTGQNCLPVRIVVEVKLNAGKSNAGGTDQLANYLSLLRPEDDSEYSAFVYLTRSFERGMRDLSESLQTGGISQAHRSRAYCLSWADILEVSRDLIGSAQGNNRLILSDVAKLLTRRKLHRPESDVSGLLNQSGFSVEVSDHATSVSFGTDCPINQIVSSDVIDVYGHLGDLPVPECQTHKRP